MNTGKHDYRALCFRAFEGKGGIYFPIMVYTGERDERELPKFRVVLAENVVRMRRDGLDYWGISCQDEETGDSQWYDYRDCVSLENWDVLRRMLTYRFGWMRWVEGLTERVINQAKEQFWRRTNHES